MTASMLHARGSADSETLPTAPLRLAELVGALALATDAGAALPPESSLRTSIIALELGRRLGLAEASLRDLFYTALLRHIGCSAVAHEESQAAGNELELSRALRPLDKWTPVAALPALARGLAVGKGPLRKGLAVAKFFARGGAATLVSRTFAGRCEVAVRFASRLGLGAGVQRALDEAFERADGGGLPRAIPGEALSMVARVVAVAELASLFMVAGGVESARAVVAERVGGQVDAEVAAVFLLHAPAILERASGSSLWTRALAGEPTPHAFVDPAGILAWAELVADYTDLKSPHTLGHSREVAEIAVAAASAVRLPAASVEALRLAALLHDVGRATVSNAIWDKSGPLDAGELELVRAHAFETGRILSRTAPLAGIARLASLAHERCDGSGYHRGFHGSAISTGARLLAVADVAQALTQPRAHRAAWPLDEIARHLEEGVVGGAFCREAVDAVLGVLGARPGRARNPLPAGLSEREVEVLGLVARGLTDKEIAGRLGISHRTVQHHNRHAFDKIGVSTRGAVALFVIEHGLLPR